MTTTRFALLMALLPACASAQTDPENMHARNACRLAVQVVETGHPAPHKRWAFDYVVICGRAGGSALASAIHRTRSVTDTAELEAITRAVRTFRDGAVFNTALDVAGDRSASVPARVIAFRTLLVTLSPGRSLSYANMTTVGMIDSCLGRPRSLHDEVSEGAPLPPRYTELLRDTAARVRDDPTESAEVRQAARCAARYAQS